MLEGDRLYKEVAKRRSERKNKASGKFDKKKLNYNLKGDKLEFDTPKLKPTELESLKQGIRKKIKSDSIRDYILYIVIFLVLFISFYVFMN